MPVTAAITLSFTPRLQVVNSFLVSSVSLGAALASLMRFITRWRGRLGQGQGRRGVGTGRKLVLRHFARRVSRSPIDRHSGGTPSASGRRHRTPGHPIGARVFLRLDRHGRIFVP